MTKRLTDWIHNEVTLHGNRLILLTFNIATVTTSFIRFFGSDSEKLHTLLRIK